MDVSPRIKICGITSVKDGLIAAENGADAIGLVFYRNSRRYVTVEQAVEIVRALPPFISVVGLFVDPSDDLVQSVLGSVPLSLLQFHGNESETECSRWGMRYMKAFRVRPEVAVPEMVAPYDTACGYLLDSYKPGEVGGTGESFDWDLIPHELNKPVVLAGGLSPDNIAQAINRVRPYGVDVSSGVESQPGIKDHDKIKAFIKAAGK
ncbi:phosphoribosylanthranilate isomerase [Endozoicomonas elysicola]|uniref:N-(5'-phosphoribosyl)anthranilate isomerase n=1 Tax=Endozoicomonas elysicola TaxID=305900 RepID=A0A081KCT8_9GAMM|nr:phosphoribosylanthranilate isomerase [Endozoicomonas elysicola]KEI71964.1 N-(5'-phosphoribosyl)anthranilate isomerase [Endozoicomonas elysicola]